MLIVAIIMIFTTPVFLFIAAIIHALPAGTIVVVTVATAFPAILAVLPAAAVVPDRVGQHVHGYDRIDRIVAGDDQLATFRAFLGGLVADQDIEARAGMERCREGVVDQPPVLALALEGYASDMQFAVADVADRDGSLGTATSLDAAEAGRSGYGDLPGRCKSGKRDAF